MAISQKSIDILNNSMTFFEEQFRDISNEIIDDFSNIIESVLRSMKINDVKLELLPYGSFYTGSNYQLMEYCEFYVLLSANRESIRYAENQEIKKIQKKKKSSSLSPKSIYNKILNDSNVAPAQATTQITAQFLANKIAEKMATLINKDDKIFVKDNLVHIKIKLDSSEFPAQINIFCGYKFDEDDDSVELKKYGYYIKENPVQKLNAILDKNTETNGNYLLLCKFLKMLELELVISELSELMLCKKSLLFESILYNVPNNMFELDEKSRFIKVVNYLLLSDFTEFVMPGSDVPLFNKNGYYTEVLCKKFKAKMEYLLKNLDEIIDNSIKKAEAENLNNSEEIIKNDNQTKSNENSEN